MSVGRNPWGSPAAARARSSVNLFNVMDEELAAKLQREEEEQFELEIAGRFGDDRQVGWCFIEVPSAGCEYGVMSVVQQEIPINERPSTSDDDPDYTFALELQAQEAEEYDRLRRQEEASMERIRVIQQTHPKREEIRQTLLQKFYFSSSDSPSSGSDDRTSDEDHETEIDDDATDVSLVVDSTSDVSPAASASDWSIVDKVAEGSSKTSDNGGDDAHSDASNDAHSDADSDVAHHSIDTLAGKPQPRKKLSSLGPTLKHADRKPRAYRHSYHRRPKTHGDPTTEPI